MKYYIKILRSNLDNILSSESISPSSFYINRAFGYRRFDRLSNAQNENMLRIDTSILDDVNDVIYLELEGEDDQLVSVAPKNVQGSFFVRKTIYLYPWNCRILFKSAEDARNSVFLCKSSLTNKMWEFYPVGVIESKNQAGIETLETMQSFFVSPQEEAEVDNRVNRQKGFLLTYYLGLLASLTPELARLLQAKIKIYGLAIALSGMRMPAEGVLNEIDYQKKVFNANDPNQIALKSRWNENVTGRFSTQADRDYFEELLARFGVLKSAMYAFAAEQGIAVSPRLDTTKSSGIGWRHFGTQIDEYTQVIINSALESNHVRREEMALKTGSCFYIPGHEGSLYEAVLNEVLKGNNWLSIERIGGEKLDVANDITYFAKEWSERKGKAWEGSEEQFFFDGLRQNIANSSPFDPNSTTDKGLRALAVYILKGEMMDELIDYMRYSCVEDYSLALGLWGGNVGYANIPKTLVQGLNLSNKSLAECYLATFHSLLGTERSVQLDPNRFMSGINHLPGPSPVVLPKHPRALPLEVLVRLSNPPLRLTKAQLNSLQVEFENSEGKIDESGLKRISQIKGIGKKKIGQIKTILRPWIIEPDRENTLFKDIEQQSKQTISSLTPTEVMRVIEPGLPEDEVARNQVERDVRWYLEGHPDPVEKLIPRLCQYLKNKKMTKGKSPWVKKIYENVDAQAIERCLLDAYLSK